MSKVISRPTFATVNTLGLRQGAKKFSVTACPSGKWKVYVPSHHQWTNYANKNYANLWYTLLQVTIGLRFQKNKNVRFISGSFSSERSSWKVKTIRCVRCILINTHLQYQCLEFTKLKCTWPIFAKTITFLTEVQDQNLLFMFFTNDYEAKFRQIAFSELVRISHGQHLPPKFFSISAFILCTGSRFYIMHGISLLRSDFRSAWIYYELLTVVL